LAFSEKTLDYKISNNKFFYFLEKLSLPIFLSHLSIRTLLINNIIFDKLTYYQKLAVFLPITIMVSLYVMILVEQIQKKRTNKQNFQKNIFI